MSIGTSGWAYPEWKQGFYPADLRESQFLTFYSTRLNAVEVNYTFCGRHVLSHATAERRLAQTHTGFVFAFRAPKPITHFHRYRLRHADDRVRQFEAALLPFRRANRLGPILFQLPRTFSIDAGVLEDFLLQTSRELRVSFEFRHPSWFCDEVYDILRRHRVALCMAERDETTTPDVVTSDFVYMRLRKSTYGPAALKALAERIGVYAQGRDVYAFFKQTEAGPSYAQALARALR